MSYKKECDFYVARSKMSECHNRIKANGLILLNIAKLNDAQSCANFARFAQRIKITDVF